MVEKICYYCGESMATEDCKLYCPIKDRIVEDEETCEECNV